MFNVYDYAAAIMHRCDQPKGDLLGHGKKKEDYLFIPSKSHTPRALAVAHCDTVFDDLPNQDERDKAYERLNKIHQDKMAKYQAGELTHKPVFYAPKHLEPAQRVNSNKIVSGALDDRLGVAIILDILPDLMPEFAFDILLTDDEEIGRTTAGDFSRDYRADSTFADYIDSRMVNYQFIFEFDRMGVDAATYDFYNSDASQLLQETGWEEVGGSFTDICDLDDFDLWACNFGCGYHDQHSLRCSVDLRELQINLLKFRYFVEELGDQVLYNTPRQRSSTSYSWSNYSGYVDKDDYYKDEKYDKYIIGSPSVTKPTTSQPKPAAKGSSNTSWFQTALQMAHNLGTRYKLALPNPNSDEGALAATTYKIGPCGELYVHVDDYDLYTDAWDELITDLSDDDDTVIIEDSPFYIKDDTSKAWDETWDRYEELYNEDSNPYTDVDEANADLLEGFSEGLLPGNSDAGGQDEVIEVD